MEIQDEIESCWRFPVFRVGTYGTSDSKRIANISFVLFSAIVVECNVPAERMNESKNETPRFKKGVIEEVQEK